MSDSLTDLLIRCTVRVDVDGIPRGTGFFVGPGRILTCAHVVGTEQRSGLTIKCVPNPGRIEAVYEGSPIGAHILRFLPSPYPDLALLYIDMIEHPCVLLHDVIDFDHPLFSFGYPKGFPKGDSVTFEYEGESFIVGRLYKVKGGQADVGLSGAPLLNRRSGTVCGVVKMSRDTSRPYGGFAVPTATANCCLPELAELQRDFHESSSVWMQFLSVDQCEKTIHSTAVVSLDREAIIREVNRRSLLSVDDLIPSKIIPKKYHVERDLQSTLVRWLHANRTGFGVIVGEAGIGKTHLLCDVVRHFAERSDFLVVFLKMEDVKRAEISQSMVRLIGVKDRFESLYDFLRFVSTGPAISILFCLDTLDLIKDRSILTEFRSDVRDFQVLILGASRPHEFEDFSDLVVDRFDLGQLEDHELVPLITNLREYYNLPESYELTPMQRELCRTPLHLSMLIKTYDRIENIPADIDVQSLYQAYLERVVPNVRVGYQPQEGTPIPILKARKEKFCFELALMMYDRRALSIDLSDNEIEGLLHGRIGMEAFDLLISDNVIKEHKWKGRERSLSFFHQTFWEFVTADALLRNRRTDDLIANYRVNLYRGVIYNLVLLARVHCETAHIANELIRHLSASPYLSPKYLLMDILLALPDPGLEEKNLLLQLCRNEEVIDYALGLVLYRRITQPFSLLFPVIEESSRQGSYETKRRICEALPLLLDADKGFALRLMAILRIDYDETRYRDDNRRRVIEALPSLLKTDPTVAEDLLWPREGDQIYTTIAALEVLWEVKGHKRREGYPVLDELLKRVVLQNEIEAIDFLIQLLSAINSSPKDAMSLVLHQASDERLLVRVCVCRNLPKLLDHFPKEVISVFELYASLREHRYRYVRRPLARAGPPLVRFLRKNRSTELRQRVMSLIELMAQDDDSIIRITLTDCLDQLVDVIPLFAMKITTKYMIYDSEAKVQQRACKAINRLAYSQIEQRKILFSILESACAQLKQRTSS